MWAVLENLLRRVRVRGLTEGPLQRVRVEGLPNDARDGVERWQDYGFAGNPNDGQGLRIEAGGHTVVIRLDRLASRPQLAAYEVCVWHEEGHRVTLKAGGKVVVDCAEFTVNASSKVVLNTPVVQASGDVTGQGTVTGVTDVVFAGKSGNNHRHGSVQTGTGQSGTPV
jgi:phage baseplate assembly protein V